MLARLRSIAKRSKWAVVAVSIAKDVRAGFAGRRGVVESTSGSTHQDFTLEESLEYIDRVFGDYLTHGQISPEELQGKRVLEIGPGDNLGVALRLAAAGADKVVTVDRFASRRDADRQARIHEALAEREGFALELLNQIEHLEGIAVEDADKILDGPFDLIVSRAVLEHVFDPARAIHAVDRLLKPGAMMIHKIDFRDHEMFSGGGQHPLTFLTIPDWIYRQMSMRSGRPNRRLVDWYRSQLSELGYDVNILTARLVGAAAELESPRRLRVVPPAALTSALEVVDEIRPRLISSYRDADPADVAVASAFVIGQKPSG